MKTFYLTENNHSHLFQASLFPKMKAVKYSNFFESIERTQGESLWVAEGLETVSRIFEAPSERFFRHQDEFKKYIHLFLIVDNAPLTSLPSLEALFKDVIIISQEGSLPLNELFKVLTLKNADRYVVSGQADDVTRTITLIRGDLSKIVVPFSTFKASGTGLEPDFSCLSIDDHGQTIKLGEYEAAVDAILYEFDPLYRRARKAEMIKKDKSFGACLRRLRLQKGLRQEDFDDIDPREIGRIERGEVAKPRKSTLEKLAKRLGVEAGEIKGY